jgi:hypothetical protein
MKALCLDQNHSNEGLVSKELEMESVADLWWRFNEYSNKLATALGRTRNIVGEYAERLAHQYYGGKLLGPSNISADIEGVDKTLYQVKSRKLNGNSSTQLSVIRSWGFDYLVVVLFEENGAIKQALEVPVEVAKEYGVKNSHQNGWVITTSKKFLNDNRSKNISASLSMLYK